VDGVDVALPALEPEPGANIMAEVYGDKPVHRSNWLWAVLALVALVLIAIAFYAAR
jgi:hypothetical protein